MSEKRPDLQETSHSPEALLTVFSKGKIVMWMAVAVLLHVLVIGSLSVDFIRDHYLFPEEARKRKEALELARKKLLEAPPKPEPAATNAAPAVTNVVVTETGTVAAAAASTNRALTAEEKLLEAHKDAPVVKEITATATTNEMPKLQDALGVSIEDTAIK